MTILNDTAPEAERILVEIYRNMPIAEKWRRLGAIYRTAKTLHGAGFLSRHPEAPPEAVKDDWVAVTLGERVLKTIKESAHGGGG